MFVLFGHTDAKRSDPCRLSVGISTLDKSSDTMMSMCVPLGRFSK